MTPRHPTTEPTPNQLREQEKLCRRWVHQARCLGSAHASTVRARQRWLDSLTEVQRARLMAAPKVLPFRRPAAPDDDDSPPPTRRMTTTETSESLYTIEEAISQ